MSKSSMTIWERAFGKEPKQGYEFRSVEVELIDNDNFKGFNISWLASGIGFGQVFFGWGVSERIKIEHPNQYGFYLDTESMSDKFIEALLKEAAPAMAELLLKHRRA